MKVVRHLIPLLAAVVLAGCGNDTISEQKPPAGYGQVSVLLTDGPIDLSEINNLYVTFDRLFVFPARDTVADTTAAPIEIMSGPITLDLLSLTNGLTTDLGLASLPEGTYRGMWLDLDAEGAWLIEADGDTHDVKVPSRRVKIITDFTVDDGIVSEIVIDMDAAASLIKTPNGTYILRPVIRQMPDRPLAASIEGTVLVQTDLGLVTPDQVLVPNPRFGHHPRNNGGGRRPGERGGNGHGRPPIDTREMVPLSVAWPMIVHAKLQGEPDDPVDEAIRDGIATLDENDGVPANRFPGRPHPRSTLVARNGHYKLWRLRKGGTFELSLHILPRSGFEVVSGPAPVELLGDVSGQDFVIRMKETAPTP